MPSAHQIALKYNLAKRERNEHASDVQVMPNGSLAHESRKKKEVRMHSELSKLSISQVYYSHIQMQGQQTSMHCAACIMPGSIQYSINPTEGEKVEHIFGTYCVYISVLQAQSDIQKEACGPEDGICINPNSTCVQHYL